MDGPRLSVIVPVYNEVGTVRTLLERVMAVPLQKEIIVVDDCSTDGTRTALEELRAATPDTPANRLVLVFQAHNQGKGAAVRAAVPHVSGDLAIIQDADLEYDPAEYPRLIQPILDGHADVVYVSRYASPGRVLMFWHTVGNKLLTLLSNMCTNLNLTDMETCYKVFLADILKRLPIRSERFGLEPELTAKVAHLRCRIHEVPIAYYGRSYSDGKKIGWKDAVSAAWTILRFRISPDIGRDAEAQDRPCRRHGVLPADLLPVRVAPPVVGDRHLVDAAAQVRHLGGELGLEAEALRADGQALQDVGPENLVAGLHVGEVQVGAHVGEECEQLVADRVPEHEHPARARVARAVDDVGVAVEDRLDEPRVLGGVVLQVGILDDRDVAAHVGDGGPHRGALALVVRLEDEHEAVRRRVRRRGAQLLEHGARPVGRAVVDDDDLLWEADGHDPLEEGPDGADLVVHRDDDRQAGPVHGGRLSQAPGGPSRRDCRGPRFALGEAHPPARPGFTKGRCRMRRVAVTGFALSLALGMSAASWAAEQGGGKEVSVKGEVIDTFCYSTMGAKGPSHKQCGIECAHKGIPVGLLDPSTGKIHILLPTKDKTALSDDVVNKMGETVTVTGHEHMKGGLAFLTAESVK